MADSDSEKQGQVADRELKTRPCSLQRILEFQIYTVKPFWVRIQSQSIAEKRV
jgi:hypothetical protein